VTCHNNMVLPNPEESCRAVDKNFRKALGLSWSQATALMGVHTLGRAEEGNSGYKGPWVTGQHAMAFTNKYFIDMVGAPWTPERTSKGKTQWRRADLKPGDRGQSMMLNTDMCLAWSSSNNVTASRDGRSCLWSTTQGMGGVTCQCKDSNGDCSNFGLSHRRCCQGNDGVGGLGIDRANNPNKQEAKHHTESSDAAKRFAKNETAWLREFQVAWKKTTEIGTTGLCQSSGGSSCADKSTVCPRHANLCGRHSWVTQNCPKTCRTCGSSGGGSSCADKSSVCPRHANLCGRHSWVTQNCPKTCRTCGSSGGSSCADKSTVCPRHAKLCPHHPWVIQNCPKTCRRCR